jgi:peptide/nickel transport system substrate-binding protein
LKIRRDSLKKITFLSGIAAAAVMSLVVACGGETEIKTVEVIKEVPVEKIVEVPVEKIVKEEVIKEVTKEVPVEVIKEVEVEKIVEKIKQVEVLKEVLVSATISEKDKAASSAIFNRPPEANPKRGGELRTGWPIAANHYDLHQGTIAYGGMTMMYNNLVYQNAADGERTLIPDLAASWTMSDDGTVYTFPLREGVRWHDMQEFDSSDVIATFDRFFNPPEGVTTKAMAEKYDAIESYKANGPYEVEFKLKQLTPWFLELLAADPLFYPGVIYAEHELTRTNGDLRSEISAGTGPFTVKEIQAGEMWVLEANANYWDPELPYVDSIKQFHIGAWPDRGAAVLTGQTDFAWNVSFDTWKEGASQPNKFQVGLPSGTGGWGIWYNQDRPGFSEQKVRQAIHLALDRKSISDIITSVVIPFPQAHWGGPHPYQIDGWDQLPGWRNEKEADVARAKELMAEAGFPDGFVAKKLVLSQPAPFSEVSGPAILAEMADKLGITYEETAVIERSLEGDTLTERDWDIFIGPSGTGSDTMDPTKMWQKYYACDGGMNFSGHCDSTLDGLLEQLLVETDESVRQSLATQAMENLNDNPPHWYCCGTAGIPMARTYVKGLSIPTRINGGWKRFETVWLDK